MLNLKEIKGLKRFSVIALSLVMSAAVFTGCSQSTTQNTTQGAAPGAPQGEANADAETTVNFPTKPVTIIVHTKAGGPTDLMARELGRAAEPLLGQPVVIENKPAGSGAAQMSSLTTAAPDGHTLATITPSQMGQWNSNLKDQFKLDSFSYVSGVQIDPYIIVVHADSPFQTLQDLINHAKENPGKLNVGGYGAVGSGHNVAWNILAEKAGVQANWTPYESTGEAVTALLGKHIDIANSNPGQVSQYVESGDLRILGVMADKRMADFLDVPTYAEAGFEVETAWAQFRGLFGPAGVPDEVLAKLSEVFKEAMETEQFKTYMKNAQMEDGAMDYKVFTEYIRKADALTVEWLEKLK